MNKFKSYILGLVAAVAASGAVSCQDHFDAPDLDKVPVATLVPNTTIAEFKEMMWDESNNYCNPVPVKDDGQHIIISGRVVSSDYAGNCFKYIVLQDATGALSFSINSYNLYLNYRRGQEIMVDLTEMYAGKYRGLEQVGFPSFNTSINGDETSFMSPELFRAHSQLNGLPDPAAVQPIMIDRFSELGATPAELRRWQSQLVQFNNVEFVPNESLKTLSTYHSSGETQQIRDADGNVLDVRTSGYANFWNMELPEGRGDVVAILGYYVNLAGTGGWQLTLLDANSLKNFGNPTTPLGSRENPYSIQQAIAFEVNGPATSGWLKGYIVGTVAPEVENVTSNTDIEWTATPTLGNTLVIGQTAETKDIAECVVVALPQGSALRTYGALRENPDNYGKEIKLRGSFDKVMGTYGVTGNNGTDAEFVIDGVDPNPKPKDGDGSEASPYTCAQVVAMNPAKDVISASGVWVKGYIVGYYQDYAGHFEGGGTQPANVLIADAADVTNTAQCVCVQLLAGGALRAAANLVDNPGNIGKTLAIQGDVTLYNSCAGVKSAVNYTLDGTGNGNENPNPPVGENTLTLLGKSDANGFNGWTIDAITVPAGVSNVWTWKEYNSAYYLNGSAFANNTAAEAEVYAVSPVIDLSAAKTASATFDQAAKFQTTLTSLCGLCVREAGTTAWTALTIPSWPAAGAWTWSASGAMSLDAFAGKKIQIAFKYGSSAAGADTWEVRDLTLSADAKITAEGGNNGGGETPVNPPVNPPAPGFTPGNQPGDGSFNFGDPSTLTGSFNMADEVADGTTGNTKIDVAGVAFYSGEAGIINEGSGTAARLYHQSSGAWTYRFYKNTTLTIAVAEGYHLTKVTFAPQSASHVTALGKCNFSSGAYADKVWTASDTNTTTLTIADTDAGTVSLTSVIVEYAKN